MHVFSSLIHRVDVENLQKRNGLKIPDYVLIFFNLP